MHRINLVVDLGTGFHEDGRLTVWPTSERENGVLDGYPAVDGNTRRKVRIRILVTDLWPGT